jgi:hypothetical protein
MKRIPWLIIVRVIYTLLFTSIFIVDITSCGPPSSSFEELTGTKTEASIVRESVFVIDGVEFPAFR